MAPPRAGGEVRTEGTGRRRIAIIGGGIAGLSAAWFLDRAVHEGGLSIDCRLFEAAPTTGGVIRTLKRDGYLLDLGPDSLFKAKPAAADLARSLGLGDQIVEAGRQELATLIWARGRLHPLPDGLELVAPSRILPLLTTGLISAPGKLRMMLEPFVPARRDGADESIAGFVRRRLGGEAARRIAGPLMAGIHAGDPERLSLKSTFPRLADLERKHGSLTLALRRTRAQAATGRAGPPFVSFAGGMQMLTDRMAASIRRVEMATGVAVTAVEPHAGGWRIRSAAGEPWEVDACLLAVPSHSASALVGGFDPDLAALLAGVRYVSTATVFLGFGRKDGPALPPSTGFLVPREEGRSFFGCTFVSNKFPARAPEGSVLIRAFVGGAGDEARLESSDEALVASVRKDLAAMIGLRAEPILVHVQRWPGANPQYEVGHAGLVERVDHRLGSHPGLFITGSALRGVGVPDGVDLGRSAARDLLVHLEYTGKALPAP